MELPLSLTKFICVTPVTVKNAAYLFVAPVQRIY